MKKMKYNASVVVKLPLEMKLLWQKIAHSQGCQLAPFIRFMVQKGIEIDDEIEEMENSYQKSQTKA